MNSGNRNIKLASTDDAMQIISGGNSGYVFTIEDLAPGFFDLKNGLAGEIFQKFVNYRFHVAFIIPAEHDFGERVSELIRDHSRHSFIRFYKTEQEAVQWLASV